MFGYNLTCFVGVILYDNLMDLTLQARAKHETGYVHNSGTVVITVNNNIYTALFPHSGKNSSNILECERML